MESKREIFQDELLTAANNGSCYITDILELDDESWHKIYDVLVKTLNEILDNPEYRNVN